MKLKILIPVFNDWQSVFKLLEDINLKNARGVLVNITAKKPTLGDQAEVADIVDEISWLQTSYCRWFIAEMNLSEQ